MKSKFLKNAGLAVALLAFGSVCIIGIHAQQTTTKSDVSLMATNWIGCMVVGKYETIDRIAPGPYSTTLREVEIGLRSDGVVVWRSASNAK
jgi:hypothetical protein